MSVLVDRPALSLLVVGLVLLPGPAYATALDHLDGPERHRSSAGYVAEPIDASNDTLLAETYGHQLAFQPDDMGYRHVAERYRAPNRTRRTLDRAIETGAATAPNDAVASDLRRLDRNHSFLTREFDRYHAFAVVEREAGTGIETTPANDSEVAAAVRERLVVDYERLTPAERETFRKIRNATASAETDDYRPWSDEPLPDEPIVERGGDYYSVAAYSHTDDFGFPPGFFLGVVASAFGLVSVLAAVGVALYSRWT